MSDMSLPVIAAMPRQIAVMEAWEEEFKGNAAETLLDTFSVFSGGYTRAILTS
jgi:hypothetical protein